jgi:predicted GIY-YIG superfamily endonuclease
MYTLYRINCCTDKHVYIGISRKVWDRLLVHKRKLGAMFVRKHGLKSFSLLAEFETEQEAKLAERSEVLRLKKLFEHFGYRICGAGWSQS